jgi:uncharacterized protein YpiB (UPF0302 family)
MAAKLRVLILLPLVLCCALITVKAQTTLQPGTPIERTIGPGQVHEFTVNMEENSYIQLVVEQHGIDVVVKVSSPAGKMLGEYDTPNGAEGPEHVSFVAAAAGAYRITISPLDSQDQSTGHYEIKVLELREATDQELKSNKNLEVAKAKGIALLTEIESTIPQIKSPRTRIEAQLKAAELLWEVDEKRAAKFMADAMAGIKEFLATADVGSEQYTQQYLGMSQLREEVIRILSERDPDAALSFLQSTTPRYSPMAANPRDLRAQETGLELGIANQIIQKDPNRAMQIARRSLKTGYSPSLVGTVSQLAQKNPELASELVHEIAGKLLNEEKLSKDPDAAVLAISLLKSFHTPPDSIQIIIGRRPSPFRSGLLSEDEYKQLLQKAAGEVMSYTPSSGRMYTREAIANLLSGLQSLGAELDKVITGGKAAIEKKSTEVMGVNNMNFNPLQEYQNAIGNNPVEAALESIEKAPAEYREQLYIQLAYREANNGDFARARQIINDNVTNPLQQRQVLTNLEQQETSQAVGKGKIEEALRNVSGLKTPRERATQLVQILGQIGPGRKRATALSLLEQARGMLSPSPQAQDAQQMYALFELSRAFARYDSKRSFEILEPLIDQFNDICAAARTLQGFGVEYFDEDDELNFQEGNGVENTVSQISNVLGSLALTNFDRAKATTEKLHLPEVRLKVYLEIAQQTIAGGK